MQIDFELYSDGISSLIGHYYLNEGHYSILNTLIPPQVNSQYEVTNVCVHCFLYIASYTSIILL